MQLLHARPEENQRLQARRIAESAGLQVHPGFLPHRLAVVRQRRRRVAGKQELIIPVPIPGRVLTQEVVAVERAVHRLALHVGGDNRARFVRVGQLELEHRLEQGGIGGVAHHALALQPAGALGCGKLLRRAARGRCILAPLERIRDADDLPGLLVNVLQVLQVLRDVALERVHADHGHLRRGLRVNDFHVVLVPLHACFGRERREAAERNKLVDDFLLQPVRGVLLVGYLVDVAVAQELPVDAHVFLQNHRIDVRLVVRYPRRLQRHRYDRVAELVKLAGRHGHRLCPGDDAAVAAPDREVDLLVVLGALHPLGRSAVRAYLGRAPVLAVRRRGVQLALQPVHARAAPLLAVRWKSRSKRQVFVLRADCGCGLVKHLLGDVLYILHRLQRPAHGAAAQTASLVVLQVLQLRVAHPRIEADAPGVVAVVRYVLRYHVLGRVGLRGALDVRLGLALGAHVHAVAPADVLSRLRHFEDDVVHILDAGVHARLRHYLLGMDGGDGQLADGVVRPLRVVPLNEVRRPALDGHRPLHHVVQFLEWQPVHLVAQHVLDYLRQRLVLRPHGRDLRRGQRAVYLALYHLGTDVADVRGVAVLRPRRADQRHNAPAALIERLADVHLGALALVLAIVFAKALLPERKFIVCHMASLRVWSPHFEQQPPLALGGS